MILVFSLQAPVGCDWGPPVTLSPRQSRSHPDAKCNAYSCADLQATIITIDLGMTVNSVQHNGTVVIAEVNAVLNWKFYGVIHLNIYIVLLTPVPAPVVTAISEYGLGRYHTIAGIEFNVYLIESFLYFLLIVTVGLDMYFYLNSVLIPGGQS